MKPAQPALSDKAINKVFEDYFERFGVPLQDPPLSWGHCNFTTEDIAQYGRQALAENAPIDWSRYLEPLPPDAVS
jgi:hypothetical protein